MLNITLSEEQMKTIYSTFQKDYEITMNIGLYRSDDNYRKIDLYAVYKPDQTATMFVKIYNARYYEEAKLPAATNITFENINTQTFDAFMSSVNSFLGSEDAKAKLSEKYRMIMLIEDEDDEDIELKTYSMS